jgi:hypothetical protein
LSIGFPDRKANMRKFKFLAASFVSAVALGASLVTAPSPATAALPSPVAGKAAVAATCSQAMSESSWWILLLDMGIQPYADPRSQYELLKLMERAYTGSVGLVAGEYANWVHDSCL